MPGRSRQGLTVLLVAGLLGGCQELRPPAGRSAASLVERQDGPLQVRIPVDAELSASAGEVVVKGGWGSGAGQFGRLEEASHPGPMSLAVAAGGKIVVLDQVNRRLLRFDAAGQREGELPLPGQTAEDLAVTGDDLWVLFYEPEAGPGYRLRRYGSDGSLRLDLPLSPSLELVTGLFASGSAATPDLWVEREHEEQLQVVRRGEGIPAAQQQLRARGRPHPLGGRLQASRADDRLAVVDRVYPGNYTSRLLEVETPLPLLAVDDLAMDAEGGIYLSLIMGEEGEDPEGDWKAFRHVLVVKRGAEIRTIALATEQATDTFRTLAVSREGAVHQLESTAQGIAVRRWVLGQPGGAR